MFQMTSECLTTMFDTCAWYYGLAAVGLYGICYYLEVKLDLPICDHECPGLAQKNLKRLIQKIIAEAARLPELLNRSGVPPRPEEHLPYFDPKKYNQLLATAVLNKVVDSYHNPKNDILTKEEFLKPNVDINQNTVKPEKKAPKEVASKPNESPKTSAMKIETQSELLSPAAVSSATSQSVYSDDDSESSEQLLETLIKQQKTKRPLPDLTSDEANDEEYHSIKSVTTDSTWEDNWMFKSKKNTNDGTNSIAMLIPSPTEDVKVLIGDRTADEISDLSDNHDSDNDDEYSNSSDSLSDSDEPPKSPADIPNVLVQNKTVIGGKHPLTDFIENSSDFESLTSQTSFSEAKNDLLIDEGDFVKVDKPLLDIEYSTLDMKNGNVEKMKEAINPYVERKSDSDSDGAKKNVNSVVANSGVSTESQKIIENITDTPVPAPRKSSKGDLPALNNASPKPDHDGYDDDDDEDDDDNEGDVEDVDDSDFDLVSINSSEFSFYKSRNFNAREGGSTASPIEKNKSSFDVTNEEICKEILEMVAKLPQDIVVSKIPAVKEEIKITISQTVWEPHITPKLDKAIWASENTSNSADDEDLVGTSLEVGDSMNESLGSLEMDNVIKLHIQLSPNDTISDLTPEITPSENATEEHNVEPMADETLNNTISEFVVVKEYIPEDTEEINVEVVEETPKNIINEQVEVKEYNPTNEVEATPDAGDINENTAKEDVTHELKIETTDVKKPLSPIMENKEIDITSNPQKLEPDNLKLETFEITELIQKLKNISLTGIIPQEIAKPDDNIPEAVLEVVQPKNTLIGSTDTKLPEQPEEIIIEAEAIKNVDESAVVEAQIPIIEITPNTPITINVPEIVQKLEDKLNAAKYLELLTVDIVNNPQKLSLETVPEEEDKLKEPTSIIDIEEVQKIKNILQAKLADPSDLEEPWLDKTDLISESIPAVKFQIHTMDAHKFDPVSVRVSEEVRKIEEKLEEVNNDEPSLTNVQLVEQIEPIQQISVIEEENRQSETQLQGTQVESQEIIVTLETSYITEEKMEESIFEPQIQTTDIKEKSATVEDPKVENNVRGYGWVMDGWVIEPPIEISETKEINVSEPSVKEELRKVEEYPKQTSAAVKEEKQKTETDSLKEIETNEPIQRSSEREAGKTQGILKEVQNENIVQMSVIEDGAQNINAKVEEVRVEIQDVIETINVSQIIEENLKESVIETQIQTIDVKETDTKPANESIEQSEELPKIEQNLKKVQNENYVPINIQVSVLDDAREIKTKSEEIQITEANKNEVSLIVPEEVRTIEEKLQMVQKEISVSGNVPIGDARETKPNVDKGKTKILEDLTAINVKQAVGEKLEGSIIEPKNPLTDLKEIEVAGTVPFPTVEIKSKLEEIKTGTQEIPVAINASQIIHEKLEESVIEPQTVELQETETSVIVPEEVQKIEVMPEEMQKDQSVVTEIIAKMIAPVIEPHIQSTDEKEIEVSVYIPEEVRDTEGKPGLLENTPLSLEISSENVKPELQEESVNKHRIPTNDVKAVENQKSVSVKEEIVQFKEKLEEVQKDNSGKINEQFSVVQDSPEVRAKVEEIKTDVPEVPATLNSSQIFEEKLEESVIESQIQTTISKEIEHRVPLSITEEVRKFEEHLGQFTEPIPKVEEAKTEVIEDSKIETTDVKQLRPCEPIFVISVEAEQKTETKTEEKEVPIASKSSEITEKQLEKSVIEQQIQATIVKEIEHHEPFLISEEVLPKVQEAEVIEEQNIKATDVTKISPLETVSFIITPEEQRNHETLEAAPFENSEPIKEQFSVVEDSSEMKAKFEEIKSDVQEVPVTLRSNHIIAERLEESVIEQQIQTTVITKIEHREPLSIILEVAPLLNSGSINEQFSVIVDSSEIKAKIEEIRTEDQERPVTLSSSQIVQEKLGESIIEEQIRTTVNDLSVMEEVQKIKENLGPFTEPIPKVEEDKTEIIEKPKIQTTDVKEIQPREPESVVVTEDVQNNEVTLKPLSEPISKLEEVPFTELHLLKMKNPLESVPQVKLVDFQSFPVSKLQGQATTTQSPESLTLSITSENAPKQPSSLIEMDYEIITESEIKTIPREIESTMKSSKLVAGITSKKVTTTSINLEPIATVIEKSLTPPQSETVDDKNSLALNLQTITQSPPGSRYSSPLFKPLLPTSPPPPVIKLTIVESPKSTTNTTNTGTFSINEDTTTTTTTPVTKTNDDDDVISVEVPFPGSIAEREHKKWQNAAPIANNPYSVEVLERRLSQKSHDSLPFKTIESPRPIENGKPASQEKLLVDVFKAEVPAIKRFGRDYYINEAKKASGERLRRSELLNRQLQNDSTSSDDHGSDSDYQKFMYVRSATEQFVENERRNAEYPLQKSKSSGDTNQLLNENIFAARPIMVEEDDPILERAHRIDALSTDDRDFFLLPIEEAQMNIGFSSSEASSLRSPSSLSEDSDTARIYNLRSQEIKKIKESEPKHIPPALKPKIAPKSPNILKTAPSFISAMAPPPVKLSINTKVMSKSVPAIDSAPEFDHSTKRQLPEDISNNIAIEEEIKHSLPSVKNLAKAFTETKDNPAPGPINKPKTPWHSTSNLSKPTDSVSPPKPQPIKIAEPFIRPGYSISGRSISKQVKDELRDISPKSVDSNNNQKSTVNSNTKVITPPRTPSPTPVPGALRNTLAFFENLNHK